MAKRRRVKPKKAEQRLHVVGTSLDHEVRLACHRAVNRLFRPADEVSEVETSVVDVNPPGAGRS